MTMSTGDEILCGQLAVLLLQLVAMGFQVWFLRDTLRATARAAEAAKQSAEVANKSLVTLERPYIFPDSIVPEIADRMGGSPTIEDQPPSVAFTLKNHGRSPGVLVELKAQLELLADNANPPFIPTIPARDVILAAGGASAEQVVRYSLTVGDGMKSQVERDQLVFWLFVSVRYEDMQGGEHQTQMRFRYLHREDCFTLVPGDQYMVHI